MQITLEWQGREYVIPEDKAFQIGEQVEDIIPITDLPDLAMRPNFHKIARVYGTMLRFAGAKVTDQEIWKHLWPRCARARRMDLRAKRSRC